MIAHKSRLLQIRWLEIRLEWCSQLSEVYGLFRRVSSSEEKTRRVLIGRTLNLNRSTQQANCTE